MINIPVSDLKPQGAKGKGIFKIELVRNDEVIETREIENALTLEGYNSMLNVTFRAVTQITAWYIGLVNNSGFSAAPNTDTAAAHAGWTELTTYAEATRQAWSPGAASGGSLTNGSPAVFTMNATASVYGIFVQSSNTKSGTSGVLWSVGGFASPLAVLNGDVVRITYTFTLT